MDDKTRYKLSQALIGKSAKDGGMSVSDMRLALLDLFPDEKYNLSKMTRKDIETYFTNKLQKSYKKMLIFDKIEGAAHVPSVEFIGVNKTEPVEIVEPLTNPIIELIEAKPDIEESQPTIELIEENKEIAETQPAIELIEESLPTIELIEENKENETQPVIELIEVQGSFDNAELKMAYEIFGKFMRPEQLKELNIEAGFEFTATSHFIDIGGFKREVPDEMVVCKLNYKISNIDQIISEDIIPPETCYGYKKMQDLKDKLNVAKSEIDAVYGNTYNYITNVLEYYKHMRKDIENKYQLKFVSNAYLKMYEILCKFGLPKQETIFHFGNAEFPGTFILATMQYIKVHMPDTIYEWRGSSYVPDKDNHQGLIGDTYGLWRNNKSKWIININANPTDEDSGDTTKIPNIRHMEKTIKEIKWKGCDLYTSDAGISVGEGVAESRNPLYKGLAFNDQEQLNMQITLGSCIAALRTLAPGGYFVQKLYTFFEPRTYTLFIIMSQFFEDFYIIKPLTSKPSNSEIYLFGKNFKQNDKLVEFLEFRLSQTKDIVPMPGAIFQIAEAANLDRHTTPITTKAADKSTAKVANPNKGTPLTNPDKETVEVANAKAADKSTSPDNIKAANPGNTADKSNTNDEIGIKKEIDIIYDVAELIYQRQIGLIKSNVEIYKAYNKRIGELQNIMKPVHDKCEDDWLKENKF